MLVRQQRRMLRDMPDELLMDIGILRSEIDQIAQALVDNPGVDLGMPSRPRGRSPSLDKAARRFESFQAWHGTRKPFI